MSIVHLSGGAETKKCFSFNVSAEDKLIENEKFKYAELTKLNNGCTRSSCFSCCVLES